MDQELKDILTNILENQVRLEYDMNNRFDSIEKDVKEIMEDVKFTKGAVEPLSEFEKNFELSQEKLDTRLSDIEEGLKVLAQEDFNIKKDISKLKAVK